MNPKKVALVRTLRASLLVLCLGAVAGAARGQGTAAVTDSVLVRAQRLANAGNTAAGRALLDSALNASKEGSAVYVDALFGRAMLAGSSDEARKDYLRIAVDYADSPRAEDALLRLAQMEISRNDRKAAKQYLERLALEHPAGASHSQGAYWLGRVLLDEGALAAACASFAEARTKVASGDVELVNQIGYYSRPCAAAQREADSARADSVEKTARAAKADSIARADSVTRAEAAARKKAKAARKTEARRTEAPKTAKATKTKAAAPKGTAWSAQVAAYDTPEDARRLAKRMNDRGYEARVTNEKPFRVRIGRYAHRAEAIDLVAKLKEAKITAIVVETEKP